MNKKAQRKSNNVLMRLCYRIFSLVLILGIPILFLVYTFSLKNITVIGLTHYTEDEIKKAIIQDTTDSNTILLYLKYKYFKDIKLPFVEKMEFELINRNTIKIQVYEKMVSGCVEFMGEYLYFDKDGIIVESASQPLEDIPLVLGLNFNKIILNEKLEVQKEELFDVILNLTQLIKEYELDVTTIYFDNNLEVTIDCGDIKILLGKQVTYDEALSELKNILLKANGMKLTIDMRDYVKGKDTIIANPD